MKISKKAKDRARAQRARVRGMELVNSVPYKVSLRWVFYALLQEGIFGGKGDYIHWVKVCARSRKKGRDGWRPDSIVDNSRHCILQPDKYKTRKGAIADLPRYLAAHVDLTLDHFYQQKKYVEIWFEAQAMASQFQHYTNGINLVPFGGDVSIDMKWRIAKRLELYAERYDKPIIILYYGDCDKKGFQIPVSALKDIRNWCSVDFEFVRCGLTPGQARKYNVPENPDKPGDYQWEALTDDSAREIICGALGSHLDTQLIESLNRKGRAADARWKKKVQNALESLTQKGNK